MAMASGEKCLCGTILSYIINIVQFPCVLIPAKRGRGFNYNYTALLDI